MWRFCSESVIVTYEDLFVSSFALCQRLSTSVTKLADWMGEGNAKIQKTFVDKSLPLVSSQLSSFFSSSTNWQRGSVTLKGEVILIKFPTLSSKLLQFVMASISFSSKERSQALMSRRSSIILGQLRMGARQAKNAPLTMSTCSGLRSKKRHRWLQWTGMGDIP